MMTSSRMLPFFVEVMTSNTIKCHIDFPTIMFCKYDQNVVKIYSFQQYYVSFSDNFVNEIV